MRSTPRRPRASSAARRSWSPPAASTSASRRCVYLVGEVLRRDVGQRQQHVHALADGRMRGAPAAEQPRDARLGVADAQRSEALGDVAGATGMPADDPQRLRKAQRVARVPRRREIRLTLALATQSRVRHGRGELQYPEPAALQDGDQRERRGPRASCGEGGLLEPVAEFRVDAEQQARHRDRDVVARQDVAELVRHHPLELLAREPRQGALGDADHAFAAQVAEREGVEAQGPDREALDAWPAGGDAHLLDDVGEALMVAVAGIERLAVHGAKEAFARAEARADPVEQRDGERDCEDEAGALQREDPGEGVGHGETQEEAERDDEAGYPRGHEHHADEQREQQPDAPALLPFDVEQRATRARGGAHDDGLPNFTFVNTTGVVSTVVPVVIYVLHAGVPLHTSLHRAGTPQYHLMAPFTSPSPRGAARTRVQAAARKRRRSASYRRSSAGRSPLMSTKFSVSVQQNEGYSGRYLSVSACSCSIQALPCSWCSLAASLHR